MHIAEVRTRVPIVQHTVEPSIAYRHGSEEACILLAPCLDVVSGPGWTFCILRVRFGTIFGYERVTTFTAFGILDQPIAQLLIFASSRWWLRMRTLDADSP